MKTSRQLLTLIWAALATATAAFAQNITVQKTPHTASPADELTLSSRIMVVPTGGSITATGSGVIQATEVGPSFGVPYTQVTLVPTLRLLGRTTTGTGAAEALTAGSSLTLAAGSLNAVQDIRTTAAPTFAGATFSGLTADALVYGNGSKALASAAVGTSLTFGTGTLNTIQGIRTTDSPTFAALTLTAPLTGANGGTGVANSGKTVTLGGNLATSGAFGLTLTLGATTNVTLPSTGTLATLAGAEAFTNKTYNGMTLTATTGTFTLANGKTLSVAKSLTFDGTDGTTQTFPTTSASIARTDAGQTFTGTQAFGALTATTLNGNTFTTGTGTLTIAAGKTLTQSNTLTFTGTDSSSVNFGAGGTVLYSGGAGFVSSIAGTANQITASAATGAVTLSIPSTFIAPGSIAATTGVSGTTGTFSTLTSGRVPFASTAGLLIDDSDLTFATDTLTATKVVAPTSLLVGAASGLQSKFTVVDTGTTLPRGISNVQVSSATDSANLSGYKARGTVGSETTIVTGDLLTNFRSWGHDGTTYINSGSIIVRSSGTIATSRVPSQMEFWTSTNAAPSVLTLAGTISSAQLWTLTNSLTMSGTLTGAATLTGTNTITSASGTALTLATGTTGTAFSIASATNLLTLTPGTNSQGINAITVNNPNDSANKSYALGTGSWYTSGVPYFRATKASSPGILDVLANGAAQDSWIDIGSDYTVDFTNGEFLELRKTASGYASVKAKGLGTGVARQLVLQADGSYVSIGSTSAQTVGTYGLFVNGSTSASSSSTGALQVMGGAGIAGALYTGGLINAGAGLSVTGTITSTSSISATTSLSATTTVTAGTNLTVGGNTLLTGGTAWLGADTSALIAGNGIKIAPVSNAATTERQSIQIDTYNASGASDGFLLFRRARGSQASPSAVQSGDALYSITARGYGATAFPAAPRTRVETFAAENWTDSAQGAYLAFQTTPTGGTATAEVLRISAGGNLLVGTTTEPSGTGNVVATTVMSNTLQSLASQNVTLNANGSGKTVLFTINGTEMARFSAAGGAGAALLVGTTTNTNGSLYATTSIFEGVDPGGNFIVGDGLGLSSNTRSALQMDTYSSTAANSSLIIGRHARGTFASPTGVSANDTLLSIISRGYTSSSSFSGTVARIEMFAGEAFSSTATGSYITATTTPVGSTSNGEVTRWTAAANFLVGTTAETGLTGAGGVRIGSTTATTTTGTGALVVLGGIGAAGAGWFGGNLITTDATDATTGGAGALRTSGGIFSTKTIVGGASTASSSTSTGSIINVGGLGNAGAGWFGGVLVTTDATEATTGAAGSLRTSGGLYVTKKIITASSYTSGAPTAGSAGAWKLGANQTGVALTVSATNGIRVNVDGTDYTLAVLTTNP